MKKTMLLMASVLFLFNIAGLSAQVDVDALKDDFKDFSTDVVKVLPFQSLVGSEWSDAHIGNLLDVPPHFGVGIALGATALPLESINKVMEAQDSSLPSALETMSEGAFGGFPFPAGVVNARVGGALLPFDVGLKVGMTPGTLDLGVAAVDYMLLGADIRYAILKGGLVLPKVSVGVGVNYLSGSLATGDFADQQIDGIDEYTITIKDPMISFGWETTTLDLKAQVSKGFLFVTPYAGVGVTKDISSKAGGGFSGTLTVTDGNGDEVDIEEFKAQAAAADYDVDVDEKGFLLYQTATGGFLPRIYGGVSLNLLLLRIDANVMYNITSSTLGVNLGTRIQF